MKFWTYKALAVRWDCHPRSVPRLLERLRVRGRLRLSRRLVRVPDSVVSELEKKGYGQK